MNEYVKVRPLEALAFTEATLDEGLRTVRLTPDGQVKSVSGTFIMDHEAARLIIEAFEEHGTALPIDYEHQTLGGEYAAPDGRAPAGGWIEKLFYEQGRGLQALVRWNEQTRESLRSGQYRYLSPVLQIRTDDRRAVGLHSAALTNKPAIPRMERLAASTKLNDKEFQVMAQAEEGATKSGGTLVGVPTELMVKLRDTLKMETGVSAADVLKAAIEKLKDKSEGEGESADKEVANAVRKQLSLTDDAGKSEVLLALSLHGDSGRRAEVARDVDERINLLCRGNVLNPNDHDQIAAARSLALESPDRFDALIGRMKPFVQPGRTTAPPRPGAGAKSRHTTVVNALRDYAADEKVAGLTTVRAFADLRLREAGLPKMTDGELVEYTV